MVKTNKRPLLTLPTEDKRVLLHVCCVTCMTAIVEWMLESNISPTIFFYNPNIQPKEEYEQRLYDVMQYAEKLKLPHINTIYDPSYWLENVKGFEAEMEGGKRCEKCFQIRLYKTALYAIQNNFLIFATTLGISRYKNLELINNIGINIAKEFVYIKFWDMNFRKFGTSQRMYELSKENNFYMQKFCGCDFSKIK